MKNLDIEMSHRDLNIEKLDKEIEKSMKDVDVEKIEKETKDQIIRNALLSLFIYLLPIALMFGTFLITGSRPWEKKTPKKEIIKSVTKNNLNNGSND